MILSILFSFSILSLLVLDMMHLSIAFAPVAAATTSTIDRITSICVGAAHGCSVFSNKKCKCWGNQSSLGYTISSEAGILGDSLDELGNKLPYVNVGDSISIEAVYCGAYHTCFKFQNGKIKCNGWNNEGQAGYGISVDPIGQYSNFIGNNLPFVNIGLNTSVFDVSLGKQHSCFIVSSTKQNGDISSDGNKVKCFGRNNNGQLGNGNIISVGKEMNHMGDNLQFVDFGTNVTVSSVYSGSSADHSCIIISSPAINAQRFKCWGLNTYNQLGYGDNNNRGDQENEMGDNLPLIDLGLESRAKQLALGALHTCVLLVDDVLKCFGNHAYGQLASGSNVDITATGNLTPSVPIDAGKAISLLSAGNYHTCIVYDDLTTMKCAGFNGFGQLGQGDTLSRGRSPTTTISQIPGIDLGTGSSNITSIHSGRFHNCVVIAFSQVRCFGQNTDGQLAIDAASSIGDGPDEMGYNLRAADIFSSPTLAPTRKPSSLTSKTNKPTSETSDSTPLTQSQVAGITVGVIVAFFAFIAIFCLWRRRHHKDKFVNDENVNNAAGETGAARGESNIGIGQSAAFASQSRYSVFVSFEKSDVAKNEQANIIDTIRENLKESNIEVFTSNDLSLLSDVEGEIDQSSVIVILLSENYFTRIKRVHEYFTAESRNRDNILILNCKGSRFNLDAAKSFWERSSLDEMKSVFGSELSNIEERIGNVIDISRELFHKFDTIASKAIRLNETSQLEVEAFINQIKNRVEQSTNQTNSSALIEV